MSSAKFIFPAVRGIQAGMEYYISMVPLETIPRLFLFSEIELPSEIRAQRTLNKARIPELKNYIIKNPTSYVFSALTASVDGEIDFTPINADNMYIGQISIPISAKFLINDGQHRRAAIEAALKENPNLKYEHISVVFYADLGLKRSQQIFSDLNKYAIRPTKSLNILFDHRDEMAVLSRKLCEEVNVFNGFVEKEKTSISNRSKSLFTLSGIFRGTQVLLDGLDCSTFDDKTQLAISFWDKVSQSIPEWQNVKDGVLKSSSLRQSSVCAHSITLTAIGHAGNTLLKKHPSNWENYISNLTKINWSKDSNPAWLGTVVINGSISASRASEQALINYITHILLDEIGDI